MDISLPLVAGALWIVAGAIVALLPMRLQYPPGFALLFAAPVIIAWIGWEHGTWLALFGLAAFVSMFRNPLVYFWRRARGDEPEIPK